MCVCVCEGLVGGGGQWYRPALLGFVPLSPFVFFRAEVGGHSASRRLDGSGLWLKFDGFFSWLSGFLPMRGIIDTLHRVSMVALSHKEPICVCWGSA